MSDFLHWLGINVNIVLAGLNAVTFAWWLHNRRKINRTVKGQ